MNRYDQKKEKVNTINDRTIISFFISGPIQSINRDVHLFVCRLSFVHFVSDQNWEDWRFIAKLEKLWTAFRDRFWQLFLFVLANQSTLHSVGVSRGRVSGCGHCHWWQVTDEGWYVIRKKNMIFFFFWGGAFLWLILFRFTVKRLSISCMQNFLLPLLKVLIAMFSIPLSYFVGPEWLGTVLPILLLMHLLFRIDHCCQWNIT